jgi:hypothetical protein
VASATPFVFKLKIPFQFDQIEKQRNRRRGRDPAKQTVHQVSSEREKKELRRRGEAESSAAALQTIQSASRSLAAAAVASGVASASASGVASASASSASSLSFRREWETLEFSSSFTRNSRRRWRRQIRRRRRQSTAVADTSRRDRRDRRQLWDGEGGLVGE